VNAREGLDYKDIKIRSRSKRKRRRRADGRTLGTERKNVQASGASFVVDFSDALLFIVALVFLLIQRRDCCPQ
jgi:hypothetical protein